MPYSVGLIHAIEKTEQSTLHTSHHDTRDHDSPAYQCDAYRQMIGDVEMMVDVEGGTKTMRAAGEQYLPKHPLEKTKAYNARLAIAVGGGYLKRTIGGLVGMIFRREPVVDDELDNETKDHLGDIDRRGRSIALFGRGVAARTMRDGHSWIHVEAPRRDETVTTRAEEKDAGVRPYWIAVGKADAINWRYAVRNGRPVLTLFAYRTEGVEEAGAFGERRIEQIRVLREVRGSLDDGVTVTQIQGELWELREKEGDREKPEWVLVDGPYVIENQTEIPVVFVPAKPADRLDGEFMSEPPLRDVAYEQIEHYRVRSDRQKSMTFSSIAVPWAAAKGINDEDDQSSMAWGPGGMLLLNDPEAKAGVLESHGYGLEATKEELREIEGRIAALGLQQLVSQPSPNPGTATQRILDKSEDDASLVLFAQALEAALNEARVFHDRYRSAESDGKITLNRDFHEQLMDPRLVDVLSTMVSEGKLSQETLWARLKEGEVLGDTFDAEEEWARISEEADRRMASDPVVRALREAGSGDGNEDGEGDE